MDEVINNVILQYGAIGVLFLVLTFTSYLLYKDSKKREDYILEQNDIREKKYQATIEKNQDIIVSMTKNLEKVNEMDKDLKEVKNILYRNK